MQFDSCWIGRCVPKAFSFSLALALALALPASAQTTQPATPAVAALRGAVDAVAAEAEAAQRRENEAVARAAELAGQVSDLRARVAELERPPAVVAPRWVKGVNLGPHTEASGAQPFHSLFRGFAGGGSDRTSIGWGKPDKPWEPNPALQLTAKGYPLADAAAYSYLNAAEPGDYDFSFEGKAEVIFSGKLRMTSPGVVRLDHAGGSMGFITVRGVDPADPPRNFRLTPRGSDPSRVYAPRWLARFAEGGNKIARPMDWWVTNRRRPHQWADRLRGDDWRQVGPWGVSDDLTAALAREAGCDLWLNVPDFYSDESIEAMALFYREGVSPNSTLWAEISSELWNPDFDQRRRIDALARARGVQFHEAYAAECVRIAKAWRRGWAKGTNPVTLAVVLPCQTGSPSLTREVFKAIRKQIGQGAKDIGFTHVAVSGYFSYDPAADRELEALEQAGNLAGAVDRYFALLNADTATPQQRRLDQRAAWQAEGLLPAVYEGGLGMVEYNPLLRRAAAVATKRAARNDPRMGQFVRDALAATERDYGPLPPGSPFVYFDLLDKEGWGLLESVDQPATAKWSAWTAYPN